jgi:hypothetical protein
MNDEIVVVFPPVSEGFVSEALCELTRVLQPITGEGQHGLLGGEYGYGCDYENDVFMMHPFCWCERPECPWCRECFCPNEYEYHAPDGTVITEEEHACYSFEDYPRFFESMVFIGEQCGNCTNTVERAPNFLFKPTGAKVSWYKYIGRSMEIDGELPHDFLSICLKSLQGPPVPSNQENPQ